MINILLTISSFVGAVGWFAFAYVSIQRYQERKREVSRLFKLADVHEEITKVGLTPSHK